METRSTPPDGLPVPCGTPVPKEVPSFAGDQWSLAIESVTDWPNEISVQEGDCQEIVNSLFLGRNGIDSLIETRHTCGAERFLST